MREARQNLPIMAWVIGAVLIFNGAAGAWLLMRTFQGAGLLVIPTMADEKTSQIACVILGLGFLCFLLAGILLLLRRSAAAFLFLIGAIFYAMYFVTAFIFPIVPAALVRMSSNSFSATDGIFLAIFVFGGCLFPLAVAFALYRYIRSLLP